MAFEFYFSISRTAVEIVAAAVVASAVVYLAKELMDEEDEKALEN